MRYKVLIPQPVAETGKRYLGERGYEIKTGSGLSAAELISDIADCHAVLARIEKYPAEVLEAAPFLKIIARHGVGVDNIDVKRAEELGIWVTNAPESNSNTVAEHTIGILFALAKHTVRTVSEFRDGNYEIRNQIRGNDLEGKILGIAGVGKIGGRVAEKAAHGLSMNVLAYDPYASNDAFPDFIERVPEWDRLFRRSDFVSLHIPSNEATRGIVGKHEFELMKPTAYIINAARGEIVDEKALIDALRSGQIAGAGIDVFEQEPPDRTNPLLHMQNVIATPHTAAMTEEAMQRMALHAAMCIDDVLSGRVPEWPVNRPNPPRSHKQGEHTNG